MGELVVLIADELDGSEECARCHHPLDQHGEAEYTVGLRPKVDYSFCVAFDCSCEGFVEV